MENNVNQNTEQNVNQATPEIKTEEVAKKEKKKKEPKQPKEKKEQPDTQDQLCYLGALIFLVLALVPILAKNLDPNYTGERPNETTGGSSAEAVTQRLKCSKTVQQSGYSYVVDVSTIYKDEKPQTSEIVYTLSLGVGSTLDLTTLESPEFVEIASLQSSAISSDDRGIANIDGKTTKTQVITIRYSDDSNLLNEPVLDSHNKDITIQEGNYRNDTYMCQITQEG